MRGLWIGILLLLFAAPAMASDFRTVELRVKGKGWRVIWCQSIVMVEPLTQSTSRLVTSGGRYKLEHSDAEALQRIGEAGCRSPR